MAWVETIAVYAITGAAAAYLVRTIYRIFRPPKRGGAGGCASCSANPNEGAGPR